MQQGWQSPTEQDATVVIEQLGRKPRGFLGTAKRCRYGFPQVIVNHPVYTEGEEPQVFPTLYWLTCPYLQRETARLESAGKIGEFQAMVSEDQELNQRMATAHEEYARQRMEVVPTAVQEAMERNYAKRYKVLRDSGIGGIRSQEGIKCLHTHLAHYLAGGNNPAGHWTATQICDVNGCPTGRCREELGHQ